jgi:DNA-directed RNA polymerase omega subunit
MNYVTSDEIIGKAANKYEAVVVAAMRARQLNLLQKKQLEMLQMQPREEEPEEAGEEGGDKQVEGEVRQKVIVLAMRELLSEEIKFRNLEA